MLFDTHEPDFQYSVAWIDTLASGSSLGRSVLLFGNHAREEDLDPRRKDRRPRPARHVAVPFTFPSGLLNRTTMRAFNAAYFAAAGAESGFVDFDRFFFPLDFLENWNRMYGRKGFVQYQCVFPDDGRKAVADVLERCSRDGRGSFLAVLKRFGAASNAPLSFPTAGYTLSLDLPVRDGLWEWLDRLDELVIEHGGRVYLAKDARMSSGSFRAMYPRLDEWLEVKARVDPDHRIASSLGARLKMEA